MEVVGVIPDLIALVTEGVHEPASYGIGRWLIEEVEEVRQRSFLSCR
jgi:hypothetical protein